MHEPRPSRWPLILSAAAIVVVALAAYWNSFQGVFVFDDTRAIVNNPTIRALWPPGPVLSTPHNGSPVAGRPVVNLSLAVNYAFGGTNLWGYHAVNLAVHILAALMLFGIVRRTLLLPSLRGRFAGQSTALALAVALIWAAHPLQTESVTYICQRAESLGALLYLATIYCCIRAFAGERGAAWQVLAVAACLLGMGAKETVASAPLIVLLYDRTFVSCSFKEALKKRRGLYLALAATWLLLAALVVSAQGRGGTAGFGQGTNSWDYARTQFGVIVHYLRLCLWPHPLVLDYKWPLATAASQIIPYALIVGLLLAATIWALIHRSAAGFLGAWFFLMLAPTSSFIPVADVAFEHRMYLPLAAVVILAVVAAGELWRRILSASLPPGQGRSAWSWAIPLAVVGGLVAGEACLTVLRNRDYHSALRTYQDIVRKAPHNARARNNLGMALAAQGRASEAVEQYEQALQREPNSAETRNNLGNALSSLGRLAEAVTQYEQAMKLAPNYADARGNLGNALAAMGRFDQAITQYEQALALEPEAAEIRSNLGVALAAQGRFAEAAAQYEQAMKLRPNAAGIRNNLGVALTALGRVDEAIAQYEEALKLEPSDAGIHTSLARALASQGRLDEAIAHYEQTLKLDPSSFDAHNNLGVAFASQGKFKESVRHLEQAVQLRPNDAGANRNLGIAVELYRKSLPATSSSPSALQPHP
ncbi:MAG: tetratricopeptide repeat protein [Phycisphaerae bacterium]|jgi:tetratricopeptide (TPR) repeat protein